MSFPRIFFPMAQNENESGTGNWGSFLLCLFIWNEENTELAIVQSHEKSKDEDQAIRKETPRQGQMQVSMDTRQHQVYLNQSFSFLHMLT